MQEPKHEVDPNQHQQWISHDIPNKSAGTKQLTWVGDCKKKHGGTSTL